jgi:hypothetical protein
MAFSPTMLFFDESFQAFRRAMSFQDLFRWSLGSKSKHIRVCVPAIYLSFGVLGLSGEP